MAQKFILFLIRVYQSAFPMVRSMFGWQFHCRFIPSCSQYTAKMIQEKGVFPGVIAGVKRLMHCHPMADAKWGKIGF